MNNSPSLSSAKAISFLTLFVGCMLGSAPAQQTIFYTNGMVNPGTIFITNTTNPTTLYIPSGSATQSGPIVDAGIAGVIYKTGTGTIALTGANTYSGGTTINNGTLAVQGPGGSISQSGANFYAGYSNTDNGTAMISGGGQVSSANGYLGYNPGSNGTASTWSLGSSLYDGYGGTGTLNIQNGGKVTDTTGYIGYGYLTGGTGTATVNGVNANGNASTWSNSGSLYVGYGGSGGTTNSVLNVQNGGQVASANGYIGYNSGSSGTATVTGSTNSTASTWSTGSLNVGESGTGTLNIQNGGQVTVTEDGPGAVSVAVQPGSVGSVTVDGSGSHFEATSLSVGGSASTPGGQASFALTNSATAHVATTVSTGSHGSINVTGGGLTVGSTGTLAAIDTVLVNSGGTLGGSGQVTGNVVNNGGTVAPGDPATLTVNGNYTEKSAGVLQLDIAGTNPADYDHLDVSGELSLESGSILKLDFIDGFAPTQGETFDFIEYGTLDPTANAFSTVEVEGLGPGFDYSVAPNSAGSYSLTALNNAESVPEPSTWALLLGGLGLLASWRARTRQALV